MNNKKKQHYVWQYYMRAWCNADNKLAVLRNRNYCFWASTSDVMHERYTYSLEGISSNDVKLIKQILIDSSPIPIERKMLLNWLIIPNSQLVADRIVAALGDKLNKTDQSAYEEMVKEIKDVKRNVLEELYCKIETSGKKTLDDFRNHRYDIIHSKEQINDLYIFILYVAFQYTRTVNIRQRLANSKLETSFDDINASVNVIAILMANILANRIIVNILDSVVRCYILENETEIEFLTSDQPVINLCAENADDYIPVKFNLYYPLSRKQALLITEERMESTRCTVEDVYLYNDKLVELSKSMIVSSNEECLKRYM